RKFRHAGHREAASELHRRRRPNLAAWATNQIARRDAAGVNRLIEATQRVADSQSAAYAGASGEGLRRAARQRPDLRDQLADRGASEQARAEREARAAALRLQEAEAAVAAARAAAREAEKRVREARTTATRAERAAEKAANQLARAESQDGE